MAEAISKPDKGQEKGAARPKRLSTKIDLTPMVDLGFLLITFFILTKTLSESRHIQLVLPAGHEKNTAYGQSTVLTLIPLSNEKLFFYNGDPLSAANTNAYGIINTNGIRNLILKKQLALDASKRYTRNDLSLIIKPTSQAELGNIVVVFDEVLINDLKHYSMVDIDKDDIDLMNKLAIAH